MVFAAVLIPGLIASGIAYRQNQQSARAAGEISPWYGGYVDVTVTPTFAFEDIATTNKHANTVLSFIVGSKQDACTPAWGSVYSLDEASDNLDLDRRIARLRDHGGSVTVSFGGRDNTEIAAGCDDTDKVAYAYNQVIERYNLTTIDLDLEGTNLADAVAGARRADALAGLQKDRRAHGKQLAVWVTLPVGGQGLTQEGTDAVSLLLQHNVDIAGVNVMTMDFGVSKFNNQTMAQAATTALDRTHQQLSVLYDRAGKHQSNATLWGKLGATPMIGQNDIATEVFSLKDAKALSDYAQAHKLTRLSMWSANRDRACGSNYTNTKAVSNSCSGVAQASGEFARILGNNYDNSLNSSASKVTVAETEQAPVADNPATSPYQIWTKNGRYLQGTKVVWHHSVYEAKWWTQGDLPDNPVLQTWETPWKLIGPVLPGEKPVPQPTLPAGFYTDWKGDDTYQAGQRVLFEGTPYQAKWWTKGNSPAAASSNPDANPWVPLTIEQIRELTNNKQ